MYIIIYITPRRETTGTGTYIAYLGAVFGHEDGHFLNENLLRPVPFGLIEIRAHTSDTGRHSS